MNCWHALGIEWTQDTTAIRRAYARKLKLIDPEVDPQAFIALREARDWAMALADMGAVPADGWEDANEGESGDDSAGAAALPNPHMPVEQLSEQGPGAAVDADEAAMDRLRRLVFDPVPPPPGALGDAARAVLDDAAMVNLTHAERVEDWFADLIVEGAPRTDALIDLALRRFRWTERYTDFDRPQAVDWIMQRREDRVYETELAFSGSEYSLLLNRLRQPPPRAGKLTGWLLGTRMEYLFALLQEQHPTVLRTVDQHTLSWWWDRIEEQRTAPRPIRWLREQRRRWTFSPITTAEIGGSLLIYLGVLVVPYLFVWTLLRRGFSTVERVLGFGWLAVYIVIFLAHSSTNSPPRNASPSISAATSMPPLGELAMLSDIDLVVQGATATSVTGFQLRDASPALYRKLTTIWRETHGRNAEATAWSRRAFRLLDDTFVAALRQDDTSLILDHATYYASRLDWARRRSPSLCVAILEGRSREDGPGTTEYRQKLVGRAVLRVEPSPGALPRRRTIPAAIMADAARRAELTRSAFDQALRGRGDPGKKCGAQIGLLDALRVGDSKVTVPILRGMFGPAR